MSDKNNGGPAFPGNCISAEKWTENPSNEKEEIGNLVWPGMTLRDWFAGMALSGQIADGRNGYSFHTDALKELSESCYQVADAMIKVRECKYYI